MTTYVEHIRESAKLIAKALTEFGYEADYSLDSLKALDRFFDEQSRDGKPISNGLLAHGLNTWLFALGCYVGEVICRTYGAHWLMNDKHAKPDMTATVVLRNEITAKPMERVVKRFRNGSEYGLLWYGKAIQHVLNRHAK